MQYSRHAAIRNITYLSATGTLVPESWDHTCDISRSRHDISALKAGTQFSDPGGEAELIYMVFPLEVSIIFYLWRREHY